MDGPAGTGVFVCFVCVDACFSEWACLRVRQTAASRLRPWWRFISVTVACFFVVLERSLGTCDPGPSVCAFNGSSVWNWFKGRLTLLTF